ncbi:Aste57867_13369 [Aphanomyces stellatus]|uniref:Aste57867_13369 protein n=1 Tax=Aphanomyces stellatus TaxID=120398 RepID=A0A485KXZ1_9STRA|nr:hypothetical protein As57867_013319 [Aphanomyces stellatus]VFT90208.1 Aste57867_13369 [Aphanomyces stellatus]
MKRLPLEPIFKVPGPIDRRGFSLSMATKDSGNFDCGYDTASPSKSPRRQQPYPDSPHGVTATRHRKWLKKEKIGQGAQGTVYRCVEAATHRTVAIKEVNIKGLSEQETAALMGEATVMKSLQHKHIVEYFGVKKKKHSLEISMEYMPGGSLSAYIRAVGGSLTLDRTKKYTWQLLRAVQFLHKHRIAHRDIKSANVLLSDDQSQLKLADFGALKEIGSISVVGGLKGTPHWMAPEVIKEEQTSEGWMKADIWSLGCTVLEMLTGRTPWQEFSNPLTAMYKIVSSDSTPHVPADLPPEAAEFVQSCFQRDPTKRPTATELLHSVFLKSVRKAKKLQRQHGSSLDTDTESPIQGQMNQHKSPEVDEAVTSVVAPCMPKSRIMALLHGDEEAGMAKHRRAKKPIKLEPLGPSPTTSAASSPNNQKSTPKAKAKGLDVDPAVNDVYDVARVFVLTVHSKHSNVSCRRTQSREIKSPSTATLQHLPPVLSPRMMSDTSGAATLGGAKSMAESTFPTLKQRPELRRIASAPQSMKRSTSPTELSPKTLKLPPLSARGGRDLQDNEDNNA